jgi:SAM-dependent methyltransferase
MADIQAIGRIQRRQGPVAIRNGLPLPNRRTTLSLVPGAAVGRWLGQFGRSFGGVVLDLGCGNQPYRMWLQAFGGHVIAMDAAPNLPVSARSAASHIPLREACVDVVLATELLEHVEDPEATLREVLRVLRPSGLALITVPFMYPTHEAPFDFRRFTHLGLAGALKRTGFEVGELSAKGGPVICAIHMTVLGCLAITGRLCGDLDTSRVGRAMKWMLGGVQDIALRLRLPSVELNSWSSWISLGYMVSARKPFGFTETPSSSAECASAGAAIGTR